MTKAITTVQM